MTTALSGIVCRLGLAIINLHTKFEISMLTHCENTKGITQNMQIGVVWVGRVTQGHRKVKTLTI